MAENKKKYSSARGTLIQDLLLSCSGSLAACLLVRWVSDPTPGFTVRLLIYASAALVLSGLGLILSGSTRVLSHYNSFRGGTAIVTTVLIKTAGMFLLILTGLVSIPSSALIALTLVADASFTLALLFYPRIIVSRIRAQDRSVRDLHVRANALVFGDDDEAADYAATAAQTGRYNVLGLLSRNPDLGGKVIGDFIIYSATSNEDVEALQWRLGGVDCILFPKRSRGDAENPAVPGSGNNDPVEHGMGAVGNALKRLFDCLFASLLLIVFAPLMLICMLAVLIQDGRPVIYSQERIGRNGKPFNILKFRSMRKDAEAAGPALYSGDDDPRLTPVGRFLRQHHLDELPQLWNVLRGDMSFIGYRPERQYYIRQIMAVNPRYRYLYQIRPGVTSYATLYNGYTDTLEKMLTRLDLDLYYLRNHSLWFDLRVLLLTFLNIIAGKKF